MSKLQILEDGSFAFYCPGSTFYHRYDARWTFNGDFQKPTFSPSLLNYKPGQPNEERCHLYVTDGRIRYLSDSYHNLAGQTVDMEDE
jgi:hypothetical protein